MITIARYSLPLEAQLARSKLEAAGISAFVADEHTINMDWFYSNAMGGVRLQVAEQDVQQAREILAEDCSAAVEEAAGQEPPRCPHCGSPNLGRRPRGQRRTLLGLLFGFASGKPGEIPYCKDCGTEL